MYQLSVDTPVYQRLKKLPGNVRQRIRRQIADLVNNPRPYKAKQLAVEGLDIHLEVWRIRIDKWRIVYTIDKTLKLIIVWGVHKRPPYDYQDIPDILESL